MFNRKISEDYLVRYGKEPEVMPKRTELHKINDFTSRFDVKEVMFS